MQIHLHQVRYTYRGRHITAPHAASREQERTVLDIDEWRIDSGEQLLLRGISGSGKTTLINIIAGLLPPTQGEIRLDGRSLYALTEAERVRFRARNIGYVFQTHLLVPNLSVLENVEMALVFSSRSAAPERRWLASDMLERVGLSEFLRHRPAQLSAGQRLRVAVARALVNRPRLLLADEPTAALDPDTALVVMNLIQTTCREEGATLLVAAHDPSLEARFCRVVDLRTAGRLVDNPMTASSLEHSPCATA